MEYAMEKPPTASSTEASMALSDDAIIAMARDANPEHDLTAMLPFLSRFAALVAARERGKCATECESLSHRSRWVRAGINGAPMEMCQYAASRARVAQAAIAQHRDFRAQPGQEGEPYAYAVYFPDQPCEELVHSLDELLDDLTNREHTIVELYDRAARAAPQPAVTAGAVDAPAYPPLPEADKVMYPSHSEPYALWGLKKLMDYAKAYHAANATPQPATTAGDALEAAAKIAEGYPKYGDSIAEEIRALLPGTAQQKNMAYPADELLQVALAYKQYIDALPGDVVAKLPAMPGIDGDWAGEVLDRAARAQTAPAPGVEQVTPVQEIDTALHAYAQAFTARVNGWTSQNGDDFPGARVALFKAISAYSRYLADQRPPAPTA